MHEQEYKEGEEPHVTDEQETSTVNTPMSVNPSIWKKLGITQAFDLLLVNYCLESGDAPVMLKERIGETLAPGAQKFWQMSFDELVRNNWNNQ